MKQFQVNFIGGLNLELSPDNENYADEKDSLVSIRVFYILEFV